MPGRIGESWRTALVVLTAVIAAFAGYVALTGGIDTSIGGIPVRSRSWERPATIASVLAVVALWIFRDRAVALGSLLGTWRIRLPVALSAACLVGLAALTYGTYAAGGADSYGYVSQAELFAEGRLTQPLPRLRGFTWPDVPSTLTPLGYSLGPSRTTLSPTYPPGLPLLMAPLAVVDSRAVFLLVPLCAAAAVWFCAWIGRRLGEPLAGALGALLFAVSPTFLSQSMQPMSDVPVTTFWMGALLLACQPQWWGPAGAGVAASVAILIRPNLAPLAMFVVVAAAFGVTRFDLRRAAVCVAAMLPGLAVLGAIQQVRYGSPLSSGYGRASDLFKTSNIGPNLERYPRWLTETHTPFIWIWLLAPIWIVRAPRGVRAFALTLYAFVVAVFIAYLPYVYFRPEETFYTRFLLPAIPLMLVLGVCALLDLARRLTPRFASLAVIVLVIALGVVFMFESRAFGVFGIRDVERKYPDVGGFVRERLPESAFVLAMQHSGSIRYYSGRQTLRWDLLDRASLGPALDALRGSGFTPFAALDHDEAEEFRKRFGAASPEALGRMVPITTIGVTEIYAFK